MKKTLRDLAKQYWYLPLALPGAIGGIVGGSLGFLQAYCGAGPKITAKREGLETMSFSKSREMNDKIAETCHLTLKDAVEDIGMSIILRTRDGMLFPYNKFYEQITGEKYKFGKPLFEQKFKTEKNKYTKMLEDQGEKASKDLERK